MTESITFPQLCIPVGRIPSAAVAISPAMHTPSHKHPPAMHAPLPSPAMHAPCNACHPLPCMPSLAMHAPLPCMPSPAMHVAPAMYAIPCHTSPLWTEFLTHACENITFRQLLLQTVKNSCSISPWFHVWDAYHLLQFPSLLPCTPPATHTPLPCTPCHAFRETLLVTS